MKPAERDVKPQSRCTVQLLQVKPNSYFYFSTSVSWVDEVKNSSVLGTQSFSAVQYFSLFLSLEGMMNSVCFFFPVSALISIVTGNSDLG